MISLSPDDRLSCERYLLDYRDTVFPESFYSFFGRFVADINELAPSPNNALAAAYSGPLTQFGSEGASSTLASSSDSKIDRIWLDFKSIVELLPTLRADKEVSHERCPPRNHVCDSPVL
jgi:phosphoinositide-3-kinase regulatory subunit 4